MSKNIILLSDGTGNSNIKNRGTNVFKLYEALDFNGLHGSKKEQVAFYDDGVGTEEFKPLKIAGGAFGWGLARNVRNLYKRLVQIYDPGDPRDSSDPAKPAKPADKIYLFGFSRGAFTVRTLAGLIASEGILDVNRYPTDNALDKAVLQLYEDYRAKHTALLESLIYQPVMRFFFDVHGAGKLITHGDKSKEIEFIGVWDTVDAVGLPFDKATEAWDKLIFRFKFPDRKLNPKVKRACHALSINDERQSFHPLLWENDDSRIEQVWFPGVHANVGGGYPQQGLSLVALEWMLKRAEAAGLQFIPTDAAFVHDQKYAFDKLYNSRSGLGAYYQYQPRDIAKLCHDNGIKLPRIHVSAFQRIAGGIFGYAPGNLPDKFKVVDDGDVDPKTSSVINVDHPESSKILNLINPGPAAALSPLLLQKVRGYISLRRGIYYTFLAYSAFTLYWLLREDIEGKGFWGGLGAAIKVLAAPDSLLEKLGLLLWSHLWLTAIGILIFAASVVARTAMEKVFSEFWSPRRRGLRDLLDISTSERTQPPR
jgi:uncharacterized protein (DUF2235 family)